MRLVDSMTKIGNLFGFGWEWLVILLVYIGTIEYIGGIVLWMGG